MKFIGQYIQSLIARFRNDVYLEDISTGTIASGSNLGLDANNKIVKAEEASGVSLANGSDNRIVTATGTSGLNGEANFTYDGTDVACTADNFEITSANTTDPNFQLTNTTNDSTGPRFRFLNNRSADGQDNDEAGRIEFFSYDDGSPAGERYAQIISSIHDATSGEESGKLQLQVASHDGGDEDGLVLTGGSTDAEVDVTVGKGSASVTTIAGTLTMGSTAAMTNTGLLSVANQSNITGLGTITSGVWNGTAIATDQQKHLAYFEFKGYGTGDGTNYEMPEVMTDQNAPFEHNTSTGSNGLTAQTIQTVMRSGGVVMPYTGVLKKFQGWATSAGSGTVNIALFKFTPTDDTAGNLTPVQLVNESITASGNAIMNSFSETSSFDAGFTAGDIIYAAILGIDTKTFYFNSTLVVEWS